jgi:biotin carboxyl carrier protein
MKMESIRLAPKAGVVAKIILTAGSLLEDDLALELD